MSFWNHSDTAIPTPSFWRRLMFWKKPVGPQPRKYPKDVFRESIETVVFVVVLVLFLKLFVVEAYVIPTGSMAETLFGFHKRYECPECGHNFEINASEEVAPQHGPPQPVMDCTCPNCGYHKRFTPTSPAPDYTSGDRVLVHKTWYHIDPPKRWDTVVFKFPGNPQVRHEPMNYIKRLWSSGDETVAIHRGEIFLAPGGFGEADAVKGEAVDLWNSMYMRRDQPESVSAFQSSRLSAFADSSKFQLLRKPDVIAMAERRLVYDNDHQAKTLIEKGAPPRWWIDPTRMGKQAWGIDDNKSPKKFTYIGETPSFIRYQHLTENAWANPPNAKPAPIRNVIGYNSPSIGFDGQNNPIPRDYASYWASDLMLECHAKVETGTVIMELSKGQDRFQARFSEGKVAIVRTNASGETIMSERPCAFRMRWTNELRFANIDCRLRVWVNNRPVDFGTETEYPLLPISEFDALDTNKEGWTQKNDLDAPASLGATGQVEFSKIKLWRDTVYTVSGMNAPSGYTEHVNTFYVHPEHYFCLGDNSAQSSDSRDWGVVPKRLLLGRACFIFLPAHRIGFIK